jgi:uncharacterized membrane protein
MVLTDIDPNIIPFITMNTSTIILPIGMRKRVKRMTNPISKGRKNWKKDWMYNRPSTYKKLFSADFLETINSIETKRTYRV